MSRKNKHPIAPDFESLIKDISNFTLEERLEENIPSKEEVDMAIDIIIEIRTALQLLDKRYNNKITHHNIATIFASMLADMVANSEQCCPFCKVSSAIITNKVFSTRLMITRLKVEAEQENDPIERAIHNCKDPRNN